MPRHKRSKAQGSRLYPNRRIFTLQLYDNGFGRTGMHPGELDFEGEAKLLDRLAKRIDMLLGIPGNSQTTIRHDDDSFNCYVGTNTNNKALIIEPRAGGSALEWSPTYAAKWCMFVANRWREVNGYPPLDGNDSTTTSRDEERATESTLTTASGDAQT